MKALILTGLAIAATAAATPAQAGELFGGLYAHGVDTPLTLGGSPEGGVDFQLGYRGDPISARTGLEPYVFGAINSRGDTHYAAVGLSRKFGDRIYVRPGLGVAVHTGSASNNDDPSNDKIEFGSRILFAPELGVGARVNERMTIVASRTPSWRICWPTRAERQSLPPPSPPASESPNQASAPPLLEPPPRARCTILPNIQPRPTSAVTARLARKSFCGAQLVPPFVVFQMPPATLPTHMMFGFVRWMTRERMRPPILPGPSHVHESVSIPAACAPSIGATPAFFRSSSRFARAAFISVT